LTAAGWIFTDDTTYNNQKENGVYMNILKRTMIKVMSKSSGPMMEHMFVAVGDVSRAFYKKNGRESLPILTEVAVKTGVERAATMRKMMPVHTMKDVGELFKVMDLTMGLGIETVELSDNIFHCKVAKCLYGINGTSKELCEAMMAADKKMISTLLGKEIDMKILHTVAAGDKTCEIVFSSK
jgi:hypothetical protein